MVSRRDFLLRAANGFLGTALGAMWAADGKLAQARLPGEPKAKSVIYIFLCGGFSHIDTFDPKDNKHAGKLMDAIGFGDNNAAMRRPVIPILRTYKNYGKSGIPVSDWFPHVGGVIDDVAVVLSMHCHQTNHFPAVIEHCTGKAIRQFEHPCLASWVTYALGTANKNLPAFVNVGRPSSPVQLSGGYLGAQYSATPFQPGDTPVPDLLPPKEISEVRLERRREDFGQTLGHWGVPAGPYFVLPFFGPSTVRDTVALPVDIYGHPLSHVNDVSARNALGATQVVNTRAAVLGATELLESAALDPYSFQRDAYLQKRRNDIHDGNPPADQERYDLDEPAPAGGAAAAGR